MSPIDVSGQERYQGGYVDSLSVEDGTLVGTSEARIQGPPRTSILDDIVFYSTQCITPGVSGQVRLDLAFFAKKIVAATWMNVVEYIQQSISILEYSVERVR